MTAPRSSVAIKLSLISQLVRQLARIHDPEVRAAFHLLLALTIREEIDMADLQTALGDLDNEISAVSGDVTNLKQQIADLQAAGQDTSALSAAADAIEQRVSSLADLHNSVAAAAGGQPADGGGGIPPVEQPPTDTPPTDTPAQ